DSSEFVNDLIRRELGQSNPTSAASPAPAASRAAAPMGVLLDSPQAGPAPSSGSPSGRPPGGLPPGGGPRVRLSTPTPQAAPVSETPAEQGPPVCLKHGGEYAVEKCYVCSKPICPKCMELFGYVCSPLCKAKADSHGIKLPVYALQRDVVESRHWRK